MGRLSSVLLKALGALVLAGIVLSVVGTIVGIGLWVVTAVLSMIASLAVLCVFVLAVIGLVSVLDSGSTTEDGTHAPRRSTDETDPEERLRSRYVDGELTDAEFERELERLLSSDERRGRSRPNRSGARDGPSDRRRLRDR
ncbi:SHOCT domain-containing protein [Natrinema salsiterrestre]|uniref:SHOCT domain-containing protein n=1 Tax=Natrinema salsiterrestre TaxID=2950540 RepID=A0A9Q4KZJ0_9EURY|nr:SHOCT domain-containing protein [Natrinema salsiterrestre]MDF9744669.1 SHOCT domain-containing protein [Natrinema salsiterrestre]